MEISSKDNEYYREKKLNKILECDHFVLSEYTSQPYGTCIICNSFLIKDENNKWVRL
jgi:hypothetical protein